MTSLMIADLLLLIILFLIIVAIIFYIFYLLIEARKSISESALRVTEILILQKDAILKLTVHLELILETTRKLSFTEGVTEGINQEQRRASLVEQLSKHTELQVKDT